MTDAHVHAWRYTQTVSKGGGSTVVERWCKCGVTQWNAVGEREWSKGYKPTGRVR
jgi:hypothetical protein